MPKEVNAEGRIEVIMSDGRVTERLPKKNGKKGSEARGDIQNRRRCIKDIYSKYESITISDLMSEMKDHAKEYNFKMVSSRSTINDDLSVLGLQGKGRVTKEKEPDDTDATYIPFRDLERIVYKDIRQIRFSCMDTERILFSASSENRSNIDSFQTFYKPIKSFLKERKKNDKPDDARLLHIYIILKNTGLEDYIGNIFLDNCSFILYTTSHCRCIELITSLGKVWNLLHRVYCLIE